jgi:alpha-D-ribose 1-methylphosphonate 5-triphosphate diphosphatase PhnM
MLPSLKRRRLDRASRCTRDPSHTGYRIRRKKKELGVLAVVSHERRVVLATHDDDRTSSARATRMQGIGREEQVLREDLRS